MKACNHRNCETDSLDSITFSFTVRDGNRSLSKTLRIEGGFSLTSVKRIKKSGLVLVNGEPAFFEYRPIQGDIIDVTIPETGTDSVIPEKVPFEVIHEDIHMLVVNKPAGIMSHPTSRIGAGTLANGIKQYWIDRAEEHPVRLVSRLDMGTSGIILVAKSSDFHQRMASAETRKEYLAICTGITPENGIIEAELLRERGNAATMVNNDGSGKVCRTDFQRLAILNPDEQLASQQGKVELKNQNTFSLVKVALHTGRTHQIRAHMAHIGHPLAGDDLYGGSLKIMERPALHSWKLSFSNPYTNEKMVFIAPLPKDFSQILDDTGQYKSLNL